MRRQFLASLEHFFNALELGAYGLATRDKMGLATRSIESSETDVSDTLKIRGCAVDILQIYTAGTFLAGQITHAFICNRDNAEALDNIKKLNKPQKDDHVVKSSLNTHLHVVGLNVTSYAYLAHVATIKFTSSDTIQEQK